MAGALVLGGCDASPSSPYDAKYMETLDLIVKYREFSKAKNAKTRINSWNLDVDIPDNPPLETWDAQHEMPQLMMMLRNPQNNVVLGLYSMNLNGTNVRTLVTTQEIGGVVEVKGLSSLLALQMVAISLLPTSLKPLNTAVPSSI